MVVCKSELSEDIVNFLEKQKQETTEKIYPIIKKYIDYFNDFARNNAKANIIAEANIEKKPDEIVENDCTINKSNSFSLIDRLHHTIIYPWMLKLNLTIIITYTQDCGAGAYFYRIKELEDELSKILQNPQHFSMPEFINENNVGMTNHNNTWQIECLLDFSRKLTSNELQNIILGKEVKVNEYI